jgi:SAM-dependent methyltransferase
MNQFLRNQQEITDSTKFLINGKFLRNEVCEPKNWDLTLILPRLGHGNILDVGCQGSVVLNNCLKMGLHGDKVGIDLIQIPAPNGIRHLVGDITNNDLPSEYFNYITCLSVIEHGVDINKFFVESSRLLKSGGHLFMSFDYWNPKLDTDGVLVFGLPWHIFSRSEVEEMIQVGSSVDLNLNGPIDWTIQDGTIKPGYWSPCNHNYTFGMLEFIKT